MGELPRQLKTALNGRGIFMKARRRKALTIDLDQQVALYRAANASSPRAKSR